MSAAPWHAEIPAGGDRRAFLIDRLWALWWCVTFETMPVEVARNEQARLLAALRALDEQAA